MRLPCSSTRRTILAMVATLALSASPPPVAGEAARFIGQVFGPDLEPVTGARVTMVAAARADAGTGSAMERLFDARAAAGNEEFSAPEFFEALSGEDGRFTVELPGEGPFNLRVDVAGMAPLVLENLRPSIAVSPLYLRKGETIGGRVFDLKTSRPVEGARVLALPELDRGFADPAKPEVFGSLVRTGPEGVFTLEHLAPSFYRIEVTAPGYARARLERVSTDERPDQPRLVWLEEGLDVSGKVVDGKGKGVAGARVSVSRSMPRRFDMASLAAAAGSRAMTDESGAFTLPGIPRSTKMRLRAETADGAGGSIVLSPAPGRVAIGGVELRVDRPSRLAARLQDADGKPVVEATLNVSYEEQDLPGRSRGFRVREEDVVVEEGGRLVAGGIPAGVGNLRISADGFKPLEIESVDLKPGEMADLGVLTLDRGLSIGGRVIGTDEKSLKDVEVGVRSFTSRRYVGTSGETDAEGRFLLSGLDEGRYTVTATMDGYAAQSVDDVAAGTRDIDLTMKRAGKVTGRVVFGDPAAPVAGFSVRSHPKDESTGGRGFNVRAMLGDRSRTFNDPRGRFTLDGLSAGDYTIEINSPGFARKVHEGVVVEEAGVADIGDITIDAGARIAGKVTDADGGPVAGAVVRVKARGMFNFTGQEDEPTTFSGLDGRFTLKGVSPGSQTVVSEREGYSRAEARISVGDDTPPDDIVLVMGRGGRISGSARNADGSSRAGVMVMAMIPLDPMGGAPVMTDDQGSFAFENLVPGTYTVMVVGGAGGGFRGGPGAMDSQQVTVRDGETSAVVLGGGKSIRVHGSVSGPSGPVEGARVLWFPTGSSGRVPGAMRSAVTDGIGGYEVQLPEPGEWTVRVVPEGERMNAGAGFEVEVPDSEDFARDLVFASGAITGLVLSIEDNAPLESVQVTATRIPESDGDEPAGAAAGGGSRSSRSRWAGVSTRTDGTGAYRIDGLDPGVYSVEAVKDGYAPESELRVEVGGQTQGTADFLLHAGRRILVRVVDGNGQPQSGAMVGLMDDGGITPGRSPVSAMTGVDGTATLRGVSEGIHTLFAMTTDLAPSLQDGIEVPPDADGAAEIRLTPGGSLEVRVLDTERRPLEGVSITLTDPGETGMESLLPMIRRLSGVPDTTPGDGRIVFPRLAPGKYTVRAEIEGKDAEEATIEVQEGAVASITLRME